MNTADAVQAFLYNRRSLNRRPATLKWYEKHLGRFISFSENLPTEPETIERFLATVVPDEQEETRHGLYRVLKALPYPGRKLPGGYRRHHWKESL